MKTTYTFSNPLLASVYRLVKRKVGLKIEEIPFEDIAQEIEIVYFQNPTADLYTLVMLCRRAMRSLMYQYGWSPDYGKDKINYSCACMSKEEIACWEILDKKYKTMTCTEILKSYGIISPANYHATLSKMLKYQLTDKENEAAKIQASEKYRFSDRMLKADYCVCDKLLKKIAAKPETNIYKTLTKFPKERQERICNFLKKKHHLQIA